MRNVKSKIPRKITPKYLENAALFYLQKYASSSGNLRRVLMNKVRRSCKFHETDVEPSIQQVDDLIARYERSGLLNDKQYAEVKVKSLRRRGLSRRAVLEKLQIKGLSPAQIKNALAETEEENSEDEDPEFTAALALARRKKLGPFRKESGRADFMKKDMAALGRAGFSFEIARKVIKIIAS